MNKTFSCMAIDDNPDALRMIKMRIKEVDGLNLIHADTNPVSAIELLENNKLEPDLIFVDFEMPEMHGSDFALRVKGGPMVVFTTAYRDFGPESFEADAIDYLLKPITKDKLEQALKKVRVVWETKQKILKQEKPTHVLIPGTGKDNKKLFAIDDIIWAKACRNFTDIYLKDRKHTAFMNLTMLENLLPKPDFLRVSRSYLIRFSEIASLDSSSVTLQDKIRIPIGTTYKDALANYFKNRSAIRLD